MTRPEDEQKPPNACSMARFTVRSARSGIALIERTKPQATSALFLAMGLVTSTRSIFHALINRDAKRTPEHTRAVAVWLAGGAPRLARFRALIVAARNQFIKEFSATPLVVRTTSNYGPATYEMPIYIPVSKDIEAVLTDDEREMRAILQKQSSSLPMRINLLPECKAALEIWDNEIDLVENHVAQLMGLQNTS